MQLTEFLRHTLPDSGIYTAFTSGDKRHYWHQTIEDLSECIQSLGDRTDIYFAVATFVEEGTDYRGRSQDNVDQLKCFRLDLDAGEKKLATQGPEKVYANQHEAISALVGFSKETGLAPSLIVSSGEGLHVYYELDEPIIPEQWHPIAKSFQKFGASRDLKIDSSVTADHARVLRPIGSTHPNGKEVSVLKATGKVYTVDEFAKAVGHAAAPAWDLSINDDIEVKGPPKSFKKILLRCAAIESAYSDQEGTEEPFWRMAIGVAKFTMEGVSAAHALSNKHPSYDAEEVESKFDRWQKGPPLCASLAEFSSACKTCKFRGKIKTPVQLGELNVDEVAALPVQEPEEAPEPETAQEYVEQAPVAAAQVKAAPWEGFLPPGFTVKKDRHGNESMVHMMSTTRMNEVGEEVPFEIEVPFAQNVFWYGQWADSYGSDDEAQVWVHKMNGTIKRSYLMDQAFIASRTDLIRFLASKGIQATTNKRAPQAMEAYAKASLLNMSAALQAPKVTDRFGLRILEDGRMIAAQGRYIIHESGRIETAMLSKGLRPAAEHYTVPLPDSEDGTWDASVWKTHILPAAHQHVQFLQKYYGGEGFGQYRLAVTMALASPFMAFVTDGYWRGSNLPPNGMAISLFSENGGKGKTTVMAAGQLAFGIPSGLKGESDDANSTAIARLNRMSLSGTLPVNMDEMGDMESKALAILVRTVANGSSRIMATKDGGLKQNPTWSLTTTFAANKSLRENIANERKTSSAEQFRLLELYVENMPAFGSTAQISFEADWKAMNKCAGALGAIIHLSICHLGVDRINKLVGEKVEEAATILQKIHETAASRFQYRALGAVLALHDILAARGLAPFSRDGLIMEFIQAYRHTIAFVDDHVTTSDNLAVLSKCLFDLIPKTAITNKITDRRGGKVDATDFDVRGQTPRDVVARHVVSTGETYVSAQALKEWCDLNDIRESAMLGEAKRHDLLMRIYGSAASGAEDKGHSTKRWSARFNLFRGMREYAGGTGVSCYRINVAKLGFLLGDEDMAAKFARGEGKVVDFPTKPETEESPTEDVGT